MSRAPWKNRTKIKTKVEDMQLHLRISIHQLVKHGSWSRIINDHRIEIRHTTLDEITAFVNGRAIQTWKIFAKRIGGKLWLRKRDENGNKIFKEKNGKRTPDFQLRPLPPDEAFQYYVISGVTGRRYKYLYIHNRLIATRDDHNARWKRDCMSSRQRKTQQWYEFFGLSRHQKKKWIRRYGFIPGEYNPRLPCKYWQRRAEDLKLLEEIDFLSPG
jgi:hypothetical protein